MPGSPAGGRGSAAGRMARACGAAGGDGDGDGGANATGLTEGVATALRTAVSVPQAQIATRAARMNGVVRFQPAI